MGRGVLPPQAVRKNLMGSGGEWTISENRFFGIFHKKWGFLMF